MVWKALLVVIFGSLPLFSVAVLAEAGGMPPPDTQLPSANPKTSPPTATTATSGPTASPTTSTIETASPTSAPTNPPTTATPTSLPATEAPTTGLPTTSLPTTTNPTESPTTSPTSPTATPTTTNPTTSTPTVAPTSVPTTTSPTTSSPTREPTSTPTTLPTETPSQAPTPFVLQPVPPTDLANSSIVEELCLDIIASTTDDSPASFAAYWNPNATEPLYASFPEGGLALTGFTPMGFYENATVIPVMNTTTIDVAGTVCSVDLQQVGNPACSMPTFLNLTEDGFLQSWISAFDTPTCTVPALVATEDAAIAAQCAAVFDKLFPPTGMTLGTLMGTTSSLFVPNLAQFAMPLGNPNATLANITSGWTVFGWFMEYLNPFEKPTMATRTSPIFVTGSVCSFDQQVTVSFVKGNCTATPVTVPGRALMELQGNQVLRWWTGLDNTSFWGEIDACDKATAATAAAKEAEKKKKEDAAKAKKEAAKKAKKDAKAKAKKEKEAAKAKKAKDKKKSSSSSSSILLLDSFSAPWMGDLPLTMGRVDAAVGLLGLAVISVYMLEMFRVGRRRRGYEPVAETLGMEGVLTV